MLVDDVVDSSPTVIVQKKGPKSFVGCSYLLRNVNDLYFAMVTK